MPSRDPGTINRLAAAQAELEEICELLNSGSDNGRVITRLVFEELVKEFRRIERLDTRAFIRELENLELTTLWFEAYEGSPQDHEFGQRLLRKVIDNTLSFRLAGPCRKCGDFFLRRRRNQTIYCSKQCGSAMTALVRRRKLDAREREKKLVGLRSALKKWEFARPEAEWKRWLSDQTSIDLRFITRAVTKGDLQPPKTGADGHSRGKL